MSTRRKTLTKRASLLALLMILVISIATIGCDDDDDTPATTAPTSASTSSPGTTTAPTATAPEVVIDEWEFHLIQIGTGLYATFFHEAKWAAEYMADKINADGGIRGKPVKVKTYSVGTDAAETVLAATKIIDADPLFVFTAMLPHQDTAIAPLMEQHNVPFWSQTIQDELYQEYYPLFSGATNVGSQLVYGAMTGWIEREPDIKTVVALVDTSIIENEMYMDIGADELAESGVSVIEFVEFNGMTTVDLGPVVAKAINQNPDGYIASSAPHAGIKLLQELVNRGVTETRRMNFSNVIATQAFHEATKEINEGMYFGFSFDDGYPGEEHQTYLEAHKAATGEETIHSGHHGYNTMVMVKMAIEAAELTGDPDKREEERQSLWDAFVNLKDIPGILGDFSMFDGLRNQDNYLFQVREGQRVPLERNFFEGPDFVWQREILVD